MNKATSLTAKICLTLISLSILIYTSQSNIKNLLIISGIILLQSIIGAHIWFWVTRGQIDSFLEVIGASLVIGYLLALLGSQIFRGTELQRFGPIIPSIVGICISLPLVKRSFLSIGKLAMASKVIHGSVSVSIFFLATLILSTWWRFNPLDIDSWWKYQIDIPYIESYSNSIAFLGVEKTFMSQDQSSGYHWFSYGWLGSFNQIYSTEPLFILTRIFPIVSLVMCLSLSFAWATRLTESTFVRLLSPLATLVGPGFSIGSSVLIQSPGSAMSLGVGLLFSLVLFEVIEKRISLCRGLPLLLFLCVGVTGGKISTAIVIAAGICTLLVLSIIKDGKQKLSLKLTYAVILLVVLLTYFLVVRSPFTRPIQIGLFKGWIGLFITSLSLCLGLLGLVSSKRNNPIFLYSISIFLSGAILSLVLADSSGNQIYFLTGAIGLVTTPSTLGLQNLLVKSGYLSGIQNLKVKLFEERLVLIAISISAFGGAIIWKAMESRDSVLGDFGRTLAPTIILITPTIIYKFGSKLIYRVKEDFITEKIHLAFYSTGLLCGIFGIALNAFLGPIYSNGSANIRYGLSQYQQNGSVNLDYFEAGKWVRNRVPLDAFFFTNRLCLDRRGNEYNCDGLWFMGSAVTRRQFLVEGSTYSEFLFDSRQGMTDKELLSFRFSLKPDSNLHKEVWNNGVRFGWIDKRSRYSPNLERVSSILFENATIMVIQLEPPSKT